MEKYNRDTVNILGVLVDRGDFDKAFDKCKTFFDTNSAHAVYTPNPEIIMHAYRSEEYKDVLNRADMVVPDGIGVVYASKIVGKPVKGRVAGFELSSALLKWCGEQNKKVYLFGGKPGVADEAANKISENNPGIIIAGTNHGYHKSYEHIADEIAKTGADLVLVCLGAPKQEKWIDENKDKTGAKILIGAGGSLDVFAGNVKRAPLFFRKLNLEWFYRLITQPSRFVRMLDLPRFAIKVLLHGEKQKG